jgi:predicted nucleotidyltransferase
MANSYKINSSDLQQGDLGNVFASLEKAFTALNINFYLVGATARDVWFYQNKIRAIGTKDVDFAVYIPDKESYATLKKYLQENEGFTGSTQNQFVMFSPTGFVVDLLPFGAIEVEGKVMLPGTGLTKIAVNGFREIYTNATIPVDFGNDQVFNVCTLPGIVILKLIAFDDRPEARQKDIKDIALILQHYFEIESDFIYNHYNDLFEHDRDLALIAARVLGRQIKNIITESTELEQRVLRILETEINKPTDSKIAELMINQTDFSIEDAIEKLKEMVRGINDSIK